MLLQKYSTKLYGDLGEASLCRRLNVSTVPVYLLATPFVFEEGETSFDSVIKCATITPEIREAAGTSFVTGITNQQAALPWFASESDLVPIGL